MDSSQRKYTAFISYRHKPLDIAVAEELISLLEHYRVPKELRKGNMTSLGTIFRDRDELGVHYDLNDAIYPALENSDFLIVVCTPDTKDSVWIAQEIEHFLEYHDREKILVVHAAGTAEESIPQQITHIYDKGGNLLEKIIPLSIYLVDSNEKKVLSNLRKQFLQIVAFLMDDSYESLVLQQEYSSPRKRLKQEFLRLAAAILGCPYDSLVQRNKRYLYQRLMIFSIIVASCLLIFSVVVIGKNKQIDAQLRQIQISESTALAFQSRTQFAENDRLGAIRSAMAGLPSDGEERAYSVSAQAALAEALYVYSDEKFRLVANFEQDEYADTIHLSEDGCYMLTVAENASFLAEESYSIISCYDMNVKQMIWSLELEGCAPIIDVAFGDAVGYIACTEHMHVLDLIAGIEISRYEHGSDFSVEIGLDRQCLVAVGRTFNGNQETKLKCFELTTGELLGEVTLDYGSSVYEYSLSLDETVCVAVHSDKIVMVDLEKFEIINTFEISTKKIENEIIIPLADGRFIISWHDTGNIYVYQLSVGGRLTELGIMKVENPARPNHRPSLRGIHIVNQCICFLYEEHYKWMYISNVDGNTVGDWYSSTLYEKLFYSMIAADGSLVLLFEDGRLETLEIDPFYGAVMRGLGTLCEQEYVKRGFTEAFDSCSTIAIHKDPEILIFSPLSGSDYESPTVLYQGWFSKKAGIFDFDRESNVCDELLPTRASNIGGYGFVKNNQIMIVFTYDGDHYIIDAQTGEILAELSFAYSGDNSEVCFQEEPELNLLFIDEQVVDMETWTVLYTIPGLVGYQTETNSVICEDSEGMKAWSLYSVDDLMRFGSWVLNGK